MFFVDQIISTKDRLCGPWCRSQACEFSESVPTARKYNCWYSCLTVSHKIQSKQHNITREEVTLTLKEWGYFERSFTSDTKKDINVGQAVHCSSHHLKWSRWVYTVDSLTLSCTDSTYRTVHLPAIPYQNCYNLSIYIWVSNTVTSKARLPKPAFPCIGKKITGIRLWRISSMGYSLKEPSGHKQGREWRKERHPSNNTKCWGLEKQLENPNTSAPTTPVWLYQLRLLEPNTHSVFFSINIHDYAILLSHLLHTNTKQSFLCHQTPRLSSLPVSSMPRSPRKSITLICKAQKKYDWQIIREICIEHGKYLQWE